MPSSFPLRLLGSPAVFGNVTGLVTIVARPCFFISFSFPFALGYVLASAFALAGSLTWLCVSLVWLAAKGIDWLQAVARVHRRREIGNPLNHVHDDALHDLIGEGWLKHRLDLQELADLDGQHHLELVPLRG